MAEKKKGANTSTKAAAPEEEKKEPAPAQKKKSTTKKKAAKKDSEKIKEETKSAKLNEQVREILKEAAEKGIKTDFFFASTLHRYVVQLNIMTNLEKKINKTGELVTKEYVKGRENLYVNPAVSEYNKTSTAANGTVATLMKILTSLNSENPEGASKLEKMLEKLNADD